MTIILISLFFFINLVSYVNCSENYEEDDGFFNDNEPIDKIKPKREKFPQELEKDFEDFGAFNPDQVYNIIIKGKKKIYFYETIDTTSLPYNYYIAILSIINRKENSIGIKIYIDNELVYKKNKGNKIFHSINISRPGLLAIRIENLKRSKRRISLGIKSDFKRSINDMDLTKIDQKIDRSFVSLNSILWNQKLITQRIDNEYENTQHHNLIIIWSNVIEMGLMTIVMILQVIYIRKVIKYY